jgi:putative hydrolase of the HAD superfamily
MSLKSVPQVIFFDAAGTLFHVKGSVGEIYLEHARRYGVRASAGDIQQAFSRAFSDAPPLTFSVNDPKEIQACERLWWFDVVHNVFYRVGMFDGFDDYFDEVFKYFAGADAWSLYPETISALQALEDRDIEMGIVSNFDSRLYEILIGLGIDRFFESVTLSTSAGAAKPSPQIFQRALGKHGVPSSDAIHIGDSIREDVEGAKAAGLTGILLDRHDALSVPTGILKVRDLHELVTLLDAQ